MWGQDITKQTNIYIIEIPDGEREECRMFNFKNNVWKLSKSRERYK